MKQEPFDIKKIDLSGFGKTLMRAQLQECLASEKGGPICACITMEEHEANLKRAAELGLTAKE